MRAIAIWIWFCAYLNCAGWFLSAIRQLNAAGYSITLAIGFVALIVWHKKISPSLSSRPSRDIFRKFLRRFRKLFPLAFLILAAMAFLGGAIYAPNNYDALAYRIPRVLHWLAANQWHWIHTIFPRLNMRCCGIEWVSAPFIAIFKTDRLLFLINFISFLFLPGLVFSVFTRLGVRRRTAWRWMWLVPTGYCFLLQAGSIGNDLFGAVFALASVDFALRAKISKSPRCFFASVLAAALLTGVKMGNLPLLLPWAIAILPSLKLILRRPLQTACVCAFALVASALPTMILNVKYCGDWSGRVEEENGAQADFALRTSANFLLAAVQNLAPPVFPPANQWNHAVEKNLPPRFVERLSATGVEPEAAEFKLGELQVEESAGLGLGVCALAMISFSTAGIQNWKRRGGQKFSVNWKTVVILAGAVSIFALLTQSKVAPLARILAPFYALAFPALLLSPGHERLLKKFWWRAAAFAVFFIATGILIISPARPLFPVGIFLEKIHAAVAQHPSLARVETVYSVYAARNDAFAPAKEILPPGLKILGLVTSDDPETSLWRPFSSREIRHVCPQDSSKDLKALGIEFILVKTEGFEGRFGCPPGDWLKKINAQVIQKIPLRLRAGTPASDWWLVKLN